MIDEIRPQRVTVLESTLMGDIEVSSINYHVFTEPRALDETVVFFDRDNRSEEMGTYDDHDRVVEEMKQKYEAAINWDLSPWGKAPSQATFRP